MTFSLSRESLSSGLDRPLQAAHGASQFGRRDVNAFKAAVAGVNIVVGASESDR
jgi:hypothetical protein